jgi:hypothetical protein
VQGRRVRQDGVQTHVLGFDRLLACLTELLDGLGVVTQILLATNENDGKALAEVKDLRNPL